MSREDKLQRLELEVKLLKGRRSKVLKKRESEMNSTFKEFFYGLPFSHVSGYDQDNIYFEVKDPKSGYNKEIARLSLRKSNWNKENFDEVHISYYSTSTHSKFELNRLITIGKIAEIVKEFSQVILDTQQEVNRKYSKTLTKINSQIWGKDKEISDIHGEIRNEKKEKLKRKAFSKDGIDFEEPITFDLKNNYRAYHVLNLKVLNWVNNNKISCNIEIKVKNQKWDYDKNEYVELAPIVQKHDKIRYDNIRHLIENRA